MKNLSLLIFSLIAFNSINAQLPQVASGELIRHANFESTFVDNRNIDVWLPNNYSDEKQYAVVYMHDGQMLFDANTTWNKQEWGVDEVFGKLISENRIKDCIVIGIWNNDQYRFAEYFPQRAWDNISPQKQKEIINGDAYTKQSFSSKELLADNYLRFIVQELKPFIDKTYSTLPCKANTFIMGSSMGGLISYYAISEYPGVFGGAACLSTHWPAASGITLSYVDKNYPNPETHKIYFDYGTATLDSLYEPYQLKVDAMMIRNEFIKGKHFETHKFEGEAHTEIAWNKRLHIPIEFLLKK
ncbi:alpha/beta hydrolase [Carboxylicivirga sp. N1Y90]|uniref:alpha/beta hydrolase n=1 Tax=Carboxylicivirga fragile TaxID=3417571 RepID=UPI003D34A655|nr:hypothetical protein [Marinilabiliaceae bacterium N1Y90]